MITTIKEYILETINTNLSEFIDKLELLKTEYINLGVELELKIGGYQSVYISKIIIPENKRNAGIGSSFMKKLTMLADEYNVILELSPSDIYGGTVSKLKSFYNRFGFIDNKGRIRDDRFYYEMIRKPHIR